MRRCPFQQWAVLPLELRQRLRVVYSARPDVDPVSGRPLRLPPLDERVRHLADRPRCACVREDVVA